MEKQKKNWSFRSALCLLTMLLLAFAGGAGAEEIPELLEPVGIQMDTAVAYIGTIRDISVYEGAVRPAVAEAYFRVDGNVGEIHVVIGQEVKKGDKLITLNQESQLKRIESLEKTIEQLQTNDAFARKMDALELEMLHLEVEQMLFHGADEQAIALKKLAIDEEMLNQALETELRAREIEKNQAALEELKKETEDQVLYAPMDGRVMFLSNMKEGTYVRAYHPLVYLADDQALTVESAYISTSQVFSELYALINGRRYELEMVQVDIKENVALMLAGETLVTQFTILNPDEGLCAGQYAVICTVNRKAENALLVPSNAVYSDSEGRYVYLVEDGRRIRRNVKLGIINDWVTQITQGLEEGAVIYVKE